jgi:NADPH-dependent curcumin reductase CurA
MTGWMKPIQPSNNGYRVGKGIYDTQTIGPRLQGVILGKQLKIEGFIVGRFADRFDEANKILTQWLQEVIHYWLLIILEAHEVVAQGKLKWKEHVTEGFENAAKAFIEMLKGSNFGKAIIKNTEM